MALSPGQIVASKYAVVRLLGEGGMGAVYEATHTPTGRPVAIKVLLPLLAHDAECIARFDREARVAARVSSPYLAEVIDIGDTETGARYIAMELLDGESLQTRLETMGPMSVKDVLRFTFQLLDGLAKVHDAGVVHRDLNPHNVYLAKTRSGETVKIIDFGLAKIQDEDESTGVARLTQPGSVLGTPHFMAPEQARGQMRDVDARSDLYAVGVIIYRAITGTLPFKSPSYADLAMKINFETPKSPLELVPGLDKNFAAIITRAMAKEKSQRYASAREFLAAVAHWAGLPIVSDMALETTAPSGVMEVAPKIK
jgi:serine/threonine-protein kinase